MEVEGQRAERVIAVDEQLGARSGAGPRELVEPGDDPRRLEEHRGDEHRGGALVDGGGEALGQRVRRVGR